MRPSNGWKVVRAITLGSLLLVSASALYAEPKASVLLIYERPDAMPRCPAEESVRSAVSSRLGYDPFSSQAQRKVSARIRRAPRGLVADVEVSDESGQPSGTRRLSSTKGDCRELAAAMELAISIAIDPLALTRPPAPPKPSPPVQQNRAPEPLIAREPLAKPPPDPRNKVTLRASFGALGALGSAPRITAGFTAQIGLRWRLASFGLEGRADLPASTDIDGLGRVKTSLLLISAVPCAHWRFLFGCALVSLGALQGSGEEVGVPRQATTFYAAVGPRLGTEIHLVKFLYLRIHLDILATLTRTTLRIDNKDAWTTPPVSGDFGLGLAFNFQ